MATGYGGQLVRDGTEFDKPAGHSWFSAQIEERISNQIIWEFFWTQQAHLRLWRRLPWISTQ